MKAITCLLQLNQHSNSNHGRLITSHAAGEKSPVSALSDHCADRKCTCTLVAKIYANTVGSNTSLNASQQVSCLVHPSTTSEGFQLLLVDGLDFEGLSGHLSVGLSGCRGVPLDSFKITDPFANHR